LRGEPSYVWRSGQERRLQMMTAYADFRGAKVLEAGCGLGMYASQIRRRYAAQVDAFDIEAARAHKASLEVPRVLVAAGEALPYPANTFDVVYSNEVIEHVQDDRQMMRELVRVTRMGGRVLIFCPNRGYPFETHGHYWRGVYHFGNTPLINYLPRAWRDRLAPHVRVYSRRSLRALYDGLPVRVVHHGQIFGGYDNIVARAPLVGRLIRALLYPLEKTPLRWFGLSHWLVLEKMGDT
jgi:SAM-dependent methyltransferase